MAIKPTCDCKGCGKELTAFGALLLGPLEGAKRRKFHICEECFPRIRNAALAECSMMGFPRSAPFLLGTPNKQGAVTEYDMTVQIFGTILRDLLRSD